MTTSNEEVYVRHGRLNSISLSDLARNLSKIVRQVEDRQEKLVIIKNSRPAALIVGLSALEDDHC